MLLRHSILWHYLWVAPNVLLAVLALLLWKRGLRREFRSFFVYSSFQFVQWAILYPADLLPSIPDTLFWRLYWFSSLVESVIVFVLISDMFVAVFGSYAAVARLGRLLIRWGGAFLLIAATAVAAIAPIENQFWPIPATHILQEAMYVVVAGLMLLLFAGTRYFGVPWNRGFFGIALGLGITACVHLATWAVIANEGLANGRTLLDLLNLATFHIAVLIWYYYLLVPQKVASKSAVSLPENNLAVWNRELERLLQQ